MTAGPIFNSRGRQIHPSEVSLIRDKVDGYARGARSPNTARGARRKCCRCGKRFQPSVRLRMLCQSCFSNADRGATVYFDGDLA